MKLNEYQEKALHYNIPGSSTMSHVLGLGEETGEVLGLFKRSERGDGPLDKDKLVKELGDVFWYLAQVATDNGFSLEEIAWGTLWKLENRKNNGTLKGSGDR